NCGSAARAFGLRHCQRGDLLFFLARLAGATGPVFALIGFLEIEDVLADARRCPPAERLRRFRANAHVRRAEANERYWNGFWVFAGSSRSRLFERAVVLGRAEAELLLRDRQGNPWSWRDGRSDLQTIGSYTRTCRCVIDPAAEP